LDKKNWNKKRKKTLYLEEINHLKLKMSSSIRETVE
jgi:hypothetical protein